MAAPPHRFFFIHVMKTAGTTLNAVHLAATFPGDQIYPRADLDPSSYDLAVSPYWRVERLRELSAERRAAIRVYTGHFPACTAELVGGPDLVTYTLLRDPVERVISYLKHCSRYHPQHQALSLAEIYDDREWMAAFAINFQVRMFAFTNADNVQYCHDVLDIDDARLELAKTQLEAVDVVGVQERFDELVSELVSRYGWTRGSGSPMRVGAPAAVEPGLRRRIAADNEADIAFFDFARELVERRAQESPNNPQANA